MRKIISEKIPESKISVPKSWFSQKFVTQKFGQIENFNLLLLKFTARNFHRYFTRPNRFRPVQFKNN